MTRLDDPRWRGSVSQDFNGEVEFRALHRTGSTIDTLFLSWQAKIDLQLDQANVNINPPTGDQLVVGIKQQTGPAIIIHFGLASTAAGQEAAQSGVGFVVYTWDGTTLTTVSPPSWITTAAATWTRVNGPTNARWAFQMVVPINLGGIPAGVNLNTATKAFEMFYAFLVTMPSSVPEYLWPSGLPRVRSTISGFVTYPDPTLSWGKVSWGTSLNCAGDVALDRLQVGTENTPASKIALTGPNVFFARPQNLRLSGGGPLTGGTIQARFFLADWGTQLFDLTSTSWRELFPAVVHTNSADIPANSIATPSNDINLSWTLTAAERCSYDPSDASCIDKRNTHQCILVQLSATPPSSPPPTPTPTPLVFRNQSIYRNMNFESASRLARSAQVSVVGLPPLPDGRQRRDVYLYVETANMPTRVPPGGPELGPVVVSGRDTTFVATRDTTLQLPWGEVRVAEGDTVLLPTRDTIFVPRAIELEQREVWRSRSPRRSRAHGQDGGELFAAVRQAAQDGRMIAADVDSHVPTYRIHAYHTTGDSVLANGVRRPILEAQTSFGYWVGHDGEVIGWTHRLEGERLVRLAPNYYKIEVPNNGTTTITTIIEALEPPRFALSLHAGVSLPHSSFNTTHNPGFGITAGAEYWWNRRFAVAALAGYHRFGGEAAIPDLDLFHASAALEARVTSGRPSVLVDAGGGLYNFSPGSTDPGVHAGVGIEFDVSPMVSLGITGRVHTVFTTGSNTTFSSLQAGGRIRF